MMEFSFQSMRESRRLSETVHSEGEREEKTTSKHLNVLKHRFLATHAETPSLKPSPRSELCAQTQLSDRVQDHVADALFTHENRHTRKYASAATDPIPPGADPIMPPRPACADTFSYGANEEGWFDEPLTFWGVWFIVAAAMRFKRPLRRQQQVQLQVERLRHEHAMQRTVLEVQQQAVDKDPRNMGKSSLQGWVDASSVVVRTAQASRSRSSSAQRPLAAPHKRHDGRIRIPKLPTLKLKQMITPGFQPPSVRRTMPRSQIPKQQAEERVVNTARRMEEGTVKASTLAKSCTARAVASAHRDGHETLATYMLQQMHDGTATPRASPEQMSESPLEQEEFDSPLGRGTSKRKVRMGSSSSADSDPSSPKRISFATSSFVVRPKKLNDGDSDPITPMTPGSPIFELGRTASLRGSKQRTTEVKSAVSQKSRTKKSYSFFHPSGGGAESDGVPLMPFQRRRAQPIVPTQRLTRTIPEDEYTPVPLPSMRVHPTLAYPPRPPVERLTNAQRYTCRSIDEFKFRRRVESNQFHEDALQRLVIAKDRREDALALKRDFLLNRLDGAETVTWDEISSELRTVVEDLRLKHAHDQQQELREEWFETFSNSMKAICVHNDITDLLAAMQSHFEENRVELLSAESFEGLVADCATEQLALPSVQFVLCHAASAYGVPYLDFRELLELRNVHYMLEGNGERLKGNPVVEQLLLKEEIGVE